VISPGRTYGNDPVFQRPACAAAAPDRTGVVPGDFQARPAAIEVAGQIFQPGGFPVAAFIPGSARLYVSRTGKLRIAG
jgi:hypothetical protein